MKRSYIAVGVLLAAIFIGGVVFALNSNSANEGADDFYNPVLPDGADPWMVKHDDYYVYTHTTGGNVTIWKTDSPTSLTEAESKVIWTPQSGTPNSQNIWAPEIHFLDGKWYVYYAANGPGTGHRMYVLESETEDPFSDYIDRGQITDPTDKWGIDGTVIEQGKDLYYVWSGWEGDENVSQYTYIASMSDPATINSDRVELSRPEYEWETRGGSPSINEGPQILMHDDKIHIVYSGSGSWSDFYNLGILTAQKDADLLDPASWTKKETPVFESGNGVFGPGHASFTKSPDDTEDWIVYHAAKAEGSGWTRNVRMQPFTFDDEGFPDFGEPVALDEPLPLPSGDPAVIYRIHAADMETEAAREEDDLIRLTSGESVQFDFTAPKDGSYTLYFYGKNNREVMLNGSTDGTDFRLYLAENDGSTETLSVNTYSLDLKKGSNTIEISVQNGETVLSHVEFR
ncbi:family 43 glycosylhydrolase [Jeotgalibacillus proteolyticus]|uniref:Alpha-N-arabinofuranosidase n=1 Tax=Jeotgalibacillus proteolyticus TaxID=2082395 RepID=A0A2S5G9M4_9BACL|nr:family 43 glycosylhydrolase [Jeotgalibacillus proteolyticus]PPA69624.1 alpha-N-arabinofuranosidase [Jeotgalibacillus proteolyticus]